MTRHHNFLAVVLDEEAQPALAATPPTIKALPATGQYDRKLDESKVLHAVQTSVETANQTFGTKYQVLQIHFVEDDAPPITVYEQMAFHLIQQIREKTQFRDIEYKFTD